MSGPSRKAINASYHPGGATISPSLQRARKPYRVSNALLGSAIALFAGGVYAYSISSVKQDDFSDVEDLLPPVAQRANIRSIEDEARSSSSSALSRAPHAVPVTHSPDSPSKAVPSAVGVADAELGIGSSASASPSSSTTSSPGSGIRSWLAPGLPRRLDELRWVRERGLVELGKGNVIVWGAPSVDNVGRVGDEQARRSKGLKRWV